MRRVQSSPFRKQPRAEQERAAAYQAQRKLSTSYRLYSSMEWKRIRAELLAESDECVTRGCTRRATVIDHKVPHRGNQELFFDRGNLQRMCSPCHNRKTAKHDVARHPEHGYVVGARNGDKDDGPALV